MVEREGEGRGAKVKHNNIWVVPTGSSMIRIGSAQNQTRTYQIVRLHDPEMILFRSFFDLTQVELAHDSDRRG